MHLQLITLRLKLLNKYNVVHPGKGDLKSTTERRRYKFIHGYIWMPYYVQNNVPEYSRASKISAIEELDEDQLCKHSCNLCRHKLFREHKRVLVRANYAVASESSACAHTTTLGYNPIISCPTNKLVNEHEITTTSIHNFLAL